MPRPSGAHRGSVPPSVEICHRPPEPGNGRTYTWLRPVSPALSPDSRWLAYISDETGRNQVYVRPFPGSGGRWQISTDGGTEPLWAPDGRGIYYRTPASELMRAEVQTRPAFGVGARRRLFSTAAYTASPIVRMYALSPDGSRFLFQKGEAGAQQLIVVVNWFEELKRRISGGGQ